MPTKISMWDMELKRGNPTRSSLVNGINTTVTKKIRKQGANFHMDQCLEAEEYYKMVKIMESCTYHKRKYMVPKIIKIQYHRVGHIHCNLHVQLDCIWKNLCFPFALTFKLV